MGMLWLGSTTTTALTAPRGIFPCTPPLLPQQTRNTKHQAATPWMCLTLYDEFLGDKGVGLLRGDVSHHITREVRRVVGSLCLAWL